MARKILIRLGRYALIIFAGMFFYVMFWEDRLIYFPTKYPYGYWDAPKKSSIPIEEVNFSAGDGTKLHGWFARAKGPRVTLLFFHGNAGNLSDRYDWVQDLASLPADVFIIDYRGYGKSEGEPSEKGFYQDALGAYRYLVEERKVSPERLVIYGKSLGAAPACELALRKPCAGLILQAPFTNIAHMSSEVIPYLPLRWFVRTKYDNLDKISKITAPKLIVHGARDRVIPVWMGKKLYEVATEPKTLRIFDDADHNDFISLHGKGLIELFREFVDRIVPISPSDEPSRKPF